MDGNVNCRRILTATFLLVFIAVSAAAQSTTGVIFGDVKDASGAVLPGVEITIVNLATNQSRTALTNEAGAYNIPLVPIGRYDVSAALPSFRTEVRSGIAIQVDQRAKVDFTLAIG